MRKVFSIIFLVSALTGCSSSTEGIGDDDIVCPPMYDAEDCEEYIYWSKYYQEHPEEAKEDLEWYLNQ